MTCLEWEFCELTSLVVREWLRFGCNSGLSSSSTWFFFSGGVWCVWKDDDERCDSSHKLLVLLRNHLTCDSNDTLKGFLKGMDDVNTTHTHISREDSRKYRRRSYTTSWIMKRSRRQEMLDFNHGIPRRSDDETQVKERERNYDEEGGGGMIRDTRRIATFLSPGVNTPDTGLVLWKNLSLPNKTLWREQERRNQVVRGKNKDTFSASSTQLSKYLSCDDEGNLTLLGNFPVNVKEGRGKA